MSLPIPLPYRDPNSLMARDVCPHCKRETHRYRFMTPDGHWLETHHCRKHGDVAPMRSHIVNGAEWPDWSAA